MTTRSRQPWKIWRSRWDVSRPETGPEPEEHRPAAVPDPSRPVPRAVYITRAMPERHGYSEGCQRCNAMRHGQTCGTGGHSADCHRRMVVVLAQDEEYQFKVEQANFRKDQYLTEETEQTGRDAEKRVSVWSDVFMGKLIRNLLEGELKMIKKWGLGVVKQEKRHRAEKVAKDSRKEGRAQGGAKLSAEDELQDKVEVSRVRSIEGGDELPIPEATSSVASDADGEVSMRSPGPSTQMKRPHDNESAQEDQPPVHRARLQIVCSHVHGDSTMVTTWVRRLRKLSIWFRQQVEASVSTAWLRQPQEKRILPQSSGTTTGRRGGRRREAGQVPLELTPAKKVELGNFEERGVCEVVAREVMEQTPGVTVLSTEWVVTNKEHQKPQCLKLDLQHKNL